MKTNRRQAKKRRKIRVRAKIFGTAKRPRVSVFRSLKGMYIQLIDDTRGETIVSVNNKKDIVKEDAGNRKAKVAQAYLLGRALAEKAKTRKIEKVVFDRGGCVYHGRVKAVAEGIRDGGLKF